MKKIASHITTFLMLSAAVSCIPKKEGSVYVPKEGDIKFTVLQTTQDHKLHPVKSTPFSKEGYTEIGYLDLDSACATHPYLGTGVSLTDASCYLLNQMPSRKRKAFLKDAFTPTGMNLSMVRLNCGASDYATELYNYNDVAGDVEMKHFSIDRDRLYMIPVIKEVLKVRPDLFVYSAVWSEPGWMKTSGAMCGGALLDEYLPAYANYVAAYLKAYKDAGVKIDAMSIHNEPLTDQNGGCPASLVSEEQEIMLAGKLFPEAFRKAGVETKIWVHDYDYTYWERVNRILADKDVNSNIDAVAWHPYGTGTPNFQKKVLAEHPGMPMHLTERGPNKLKADIQTRKWWCDVIFDALRYGSSSYSSWNLLLDTDGQPLTGKYPCGGLEEIDLESGEIFGSTQADVFRQYCPYVKRGAEILEMESPDEDIASIAFRNPDGSYVVVISSEDLHARKKYQIKFKDKYLAVSLPLGTWSMTTVLIENQ